MRGAQPLSPASLFRDQTTADGQRRARGTWLGGEQELGHRCSLLGVGPTVGSQAWRLRPTAEILPGEFQTQRSPGPTCDTQWTQPRRSQPVSSRDCTSDDHPPEQAGSRGVSDRPPGESEGSPALIWPGSLLPAARAFKRPSVSGCSRLCTPPACSWPDCGWAGSVPRVEHVRPKAVSVTRLSRAERRQGLCFHGLGENGKPGSRHRASIWPG